MSAARPLAALIEDGTSTDVRIPVHISYEIIRLFSEGLYEIRRTPSRNSSAILRRRRE